MQNLYEGACGSCFIIRKLLSQISHNHHHQSLHHLFQHHRVMDLRMEKKGDPLAKMKPTTPSFELKKMDYRRQSYSQGGPGRRMFRASYFSVKSLLVLICLTASLLILPLILPPLPPPPFMLLLVPIGILAVLMLLVFMPPANVRDITNAYM